MSLERGAFMKQKLTVALLALLLLFSLCSCGAPKLYENAEPQNIYSADGETVLGKYVVLEAKSTDVKEKNLKDLYFNYVEPQKIDYVVILYTDKELEGTVVLSNLIYKDCTLTKTEDGQYELAGVEHATAYSAENGELVKQETESK